MLQNHIKERMSRLVSYPYFTNNATELKYFVDFQGGSDGYLLIVGPQEFVFYTDSRYIESCENAMGSNVVKLLENTYTNPLYTVFEDIKKFGFSTLFVDFRLILYQDMLNLQKGLDSLGIQVKMPALTVDKIRMVKDIQEIAMIKKSQEINEKCFFAVMSLLKEGVSEQDMVAEFEFIARKQGASGASFPPIIVFGSNSSLPHGVPTDRKLKKGDIVLFDAGVVYQGYCSDMTRTFCFGEPDEADFKEHYNILLEIQKSTLALISEGKDYFELDAFARSELAKHHLDQLFGHSLGHGVGIDIHEDPLIFHKVKETKIASGHVFTVEPGIYLPGKYGIRIEDMVYINRHGLVEILSQYPKELLILE